MEQQTEKYEGWAVVELYGHQKEVGFVTTRYFGTACLFQIDVPELPEREVVTQRPEWIGSGLAPAGATVKKSAVEGRTRMVGPGAIYALNPCTEAAARKIIENSAPRDIAVVSLPEGKQLLPGEPNDEDFDDDYDSSTGE